MQSSHSETQFELRRARACPRVSLCATPARSNVAWTSSVKPGCCELRAASGETDSSRMYPLGRGAPTLRRWDTERAIHSRGRRRNGVTKLRHGHSSARAARQLLRRGVRLDQAMHHIWNTKDDVHLAKPRFRQQLLDALPRQRMPLGVHCHLKPDNYVPLSLAETLRRSPEQGSWASLAGTVCQRRTIQNP